jgi:phage recombination protein Bet
VTNAIQKAEVVALDTMGNVQWTREVMELCKRQVCPKGVSDDEFSVFIAQCQATGLNPFTKEAYCVPRNVKVSRKGEQDRWETIHTFQPGIDGARARAGRFPDFHSSTSAAVYELDQCEVDVDAGKVAHKFNPCKPRGKLVGAWGKVTKTHGAPIVVWLPVGSRSGSSQFWQADAGSMLAKCSEMAALRKAYPVQFSGVLVREELDDEAPTRSQEVAAVLDGGAPPAPSLPAPPPPEPTVEFGEWKGLPISSLTLEQAEAASSFALAQLGAAKPGARWVAKLEANLALVQDHRDMLAAAPPAPKPDVVDAEVVPEPGSGG